MLKGFLIPNVIAYLLILAFLVVIGSYYGGSILRTYEIDQIRREAELLDNALTRYSSNHMGVNEDTLEFNEESKKLLYHKNSLYPISLDELGAIRDEDNYFSDHIDLDRWTYQVTWESGEMFYDLECDLPNGTKYHSPRSKH